MTATNIVDLVAAAKLRHQQQVANLIAAAPLARPKSFEWAGDDAVLVMLETEAGDEISYTLSVESLLNAITLATQCVNANLPAVFDSIGA